MTFPQQAQQDAPPLPQVTPVPGSRLEQLLDMREAARAALSEAQERLSAIKAGIMTDAAAAFPGAAVISITGGPNRPALRLRWHDGNWYVPAETLRNKYQGVWDELRKRQRGHWQLHLLDS